MRYSLEPTYKIYVKGYGFLSFTRKFGDKYGTKLMNTAKEIGISRYAKKIIDTTKKLLKLLKLLVKNGLKKCRSCWRFNWK